MKRALFAVTLALTSAASWAATDVTMYKSPYCGCCSKWAEHMQNEGFNVKTVMMEDNEMYKLKMQHNITPDLMSCHTAIVEGYAVEGHVPAADVRRMLKEKPAISGISTPTMPIGSPGMEQGDQKDPYVVLAFDAQGKQTPYSRQNGA